MHSAFDERQQRNWGVVQKLRGPNEVGRWSKMFIFSTFMVNIQMKVCGQEEQNVVHVVIE